jgi:hypothetical protein
MKAVRVSNRDLSVLVRLTDDRKVFEDVLSIGLKEGDIFTDFYYKNKERYRFEKTEYYNYPYLEEELLVPMIDRNPNLIQLIEEFELFI